MSHYNDTVRALSEITDTGLFEHLATAVLRGAKPELYGNLTQPGVNAEGKTVKSPVDAISFVAGANPRHMVTAQHTIGLQDDLGKKWLHDPSKVTSRKGTKSVAPAGDVVKTAVIANDERRKTPNLQVTLALTTNKEPTADVTRKAERVAHSYGIVLDIWSRSRIADHLDNSPDGQWLRKKYLNIEQERLSRDLLRELSHRSLATQQPMVEKDGQVPRDVAQAVIESLARPVGFLVGESGFGKSVACYQYLARHMEHGACGLILPHEVLASSITLDQAVDAALRQLHPALAYGSGAEACSLCSADSPLLIVVEDVSRSGQSAYLIERLVRWATSDSSQHLHAVKLARIGLSMPHGDKDQLIRDLLALPISHGEKHELLTSLVLAGYVISADLVLDGLRGLLDDAKSKSWLLDDNINRIGRRIALLPLSDRPRAVFEALDLVEPRFREPRKLGGLVYALGKSPNSDSEAILAELASRDGRFYGIHDWVSALLSRRSLSATKLLIELIGSGALPQGSQSFDGWRFGHELAALIREHPTLQSELLQKYIEIAPSKGKAILEQTIAELATPEDFLVLVKEYATMKRSFDGTLYRMLESIAVGKQPVPEWRDAYQLYSLNVAELRKKLFAMLKDTEGSIAEASLIAIDEMRDEHGRNDAEPRHPDIASGQPWPKASAQI